MIKPKKTNAMKVKEIKNEYNGKVADIEVYYTIGNRRSYHTDSLILEDASMEDEVLDYTLMFEEDYNDTILANSSVKADFESWYGDKDAWVLVILAKQ